MIHHEDDPYFATSGRWPRYARGWPSDERPLVVIYSADSVPIFQLFVMSLSIYFLMLVYGHWMLAIGYVLSTATVCGLNIAIEDNISRRRRTHHIP